MLHDAPCMLHWVQRGTGNTLTSGLYTYHSAQWRIMRLDSIVFCWDSLIPLESKAGTPIDFKGSWIRSFLFLNPQKLEHLSLFPCFGCEVLSSIPDHLSVIWLYTKIAPTLGRNWSSKCLLWFPSSDDNVYYSC